MPFMRHWKPFVAQERTLFILSWGWRYAVAMAVIAYYKHLQEGDILVYLHDLQVLQSALQTGLLPWQDLLSFAPLPQAVSIQLWLYTQPRAYAFVLCLLPLWLLSGGIEPLFVAVVVGIGNVLLYRCFTSIKCYYPHLALPAFIALFLLPSMAIWTTPPLKESLVIPAIYYVYACLLHYCHRRRLAFVHFLGTGFVLFLLWKTKYYYFATLAPLVAACFVLCCRRLPKTALLILAVVIPAVFVYLLPFIHPNLSLHAFMAALWQNHRDIVRLSNPANVYPLPFDGHPGSLIQSVLPALFNALFRPFPWDGTLWAGLVLGTECLLPVAAMFFLLKKRKRLFSALPAYWWLLLLFIAGNAVLLGIAAPNISALSRYRLIYWALWWLLCASFIIPGKKDYK